MMRRYFIDRFNDELITGTANEISRLYRVMKIRFETGESELAPAFCGEPKFNRSRMYGLHIRHDVEKFTVVSADCVVELIPYLDRWKKRQGN